MKMRMSLVMKCRDAMACMVLLALLGVGVAVAEEPVIREIRILDAQGRAYDISLVEAYTTFSAGDVAPERSALIEAIRVDVDRMRTRCGSDLAGLPARPRSARRSQHRRGRRCEWPSPTRQPYGRSGVLQ